MSAVLFPHNPVDLQKAWKFRIKTRFDGCTSNNVISNCILTFYTHNVNFLSAALRLVKILFLSGMSLSSISHDAWSPGCIFIVDKARCLNNFALRVHCNCAYVYGLKKSLHSPFRTTERKQNAYRTVKKRNGFGTFKKRR